MSNRHEDSEQDRPKGFDLRVTHRDPKTGMVIKEDPYILRVIGGDGNVKLRYWERPAGSGNLFDRHGNPIGRWEYEEKTLSSGLKHKEGKFVAGAEHIEWIAPLTEDQKISQENAALKAELAQLKAEREKKSGNKQRLE